MFLEQGRYKDALKELKEEKSTHHVDFKSILAKAENMADSELQRHWDYQNYASVKAKLSEVLGKRMGKWSEWI